MEYLSLPSVAEIIMGQSPPSSTYNKVGDGLPFYQGKAEFRDLYPEVSVYCNRPRKIAEPGDILISVRAPVGPTNITKTKACIGRGLAAIRCFEDHFDRMYLLYYLRYMEPDIASDGKGSTFDAIGKQDLENIKVPMVPLPEQKRIATILSKADRLRRLCRHARKLSDTFLQSVFLKMFGDFNHGNVFKIQKLMDDGIIIKMQDGNHGGDYPRTPEFVSQGIPFLTASNVINGRVYLDEAPRLKPERAEKLRIGWVQPNDVLLAHNATVGRVAIMPEFPGKVVLGTSLTYYRLDSKRLLPEFLAQVFRSQFFQSQLEQVMKQTTRNQVPISRQRLLFVPDLPTLYEQEKFAKVVRKYDYFRFKQLEGIRQADQLFQSLLNRAFLGGV